jgi:hypothetical protein
MHPSIMQKAHKKKSSNKILKTNNKEFFENI